MLKTIDRYVIREVLVPFFLALLIFTFVLLLPPVMEELERLVAKGVPWQTAGYIVFLLIPQALGLTIPMALLVGLLIGLGRMSADRESVALLACGVSPYRLLRPVMAIAVVATAATMYVMIEAIPDSNQRYREVLFEILTKRVESEIRPRVFYDDFPQYTLYPQDEAGPGEVGWRNLLVANTSRSDAIELFMARRGRIDLDPKQRTIRLVLTDGAQYSTGKPGEASMLRFTEQLIINLNPDSVFPPLDIARGVREKTIAQLLPDIAEKRARGESPHNEIMAIHAKFSIPAACLVFALIALALGMTVSRDGKLGGFVVGVGVIFAYYIAMFLAESAAKGHSIPAEWARWVPNLILGPFGAIALVLRARHSEGRLPFGLKFSLPAMPEWLRRRSPASDSPAAPAASASAAGPRPGGRKKGVVIVLRVPRFTSPVPSLIDRYISRLYLRVAGLSFLSLLGLFYISTFIDRADKVFKGQASAGTIGQLLIWLTPQFIYYVIPIAALLSVLVTYGLLTRTSELTVMKACGVSLYRSALSVIVLSLAFSGVLFALEQRVMAKANRRAEEIDARIKGRAPRTLNLLNRRWVVGSNGVFYHYGLFDPQKNEMFGLSQFTPKAGSWELESHTFVRRAVYRYDAWEGEQGWKQDYSTRPPVWSPIAKSPLPGLEPPEYFSKEPPDAQFMTVPELRRYIEEVRLSGFNVTPPSVELQKKLAFPFVTLVMALLAIPFGVGVGKHGALYGVGLGIVIALSYWILISAFVAIGRAGLLDPVLAGWAPNVVTAGVAGYLFLRART